MNKGKIIATIGVSGAGKSTFAHEKWMEDPLNSIIVNRDSIRQALYGYLPENVNPYYDRPDFGKLEKQVTKYEDVLIHEALNEGKTVIVDATHLTEAYINRFKFWNVPVELVWFDVLLKEALVRNSSRVRQVPEDFIHKQYGKYLRLRKDFVFGHTPTTIELNPDLPPCYLLDIDGTIAHMNGKRGAFDWKQVGVDDVCLSLKPVVQAINHFAEPGNTNSVKLIVVSGRDGVCRPETLKWLSDNGIDYDELHMRIEKDQRPDWQIKEEIWRELAKKYNILALFDDRLQVVRRARALGLKVFNVEYNNF